MSHFAWLNVGVKSLRICGGAITNIGQTRLASQQADPKPKRPLTPYFRFLEKTRPEIQKPNPELNSRLKSTSATENIDSTNSDQRSELSSESIMPDKLYKTIELEIMAYEKNILDSYQYFVLTAANHLELQVGKVWAPFKPDHFRFSLLRSAHVHKKAQVQYEVRTYHLFINLHKLTGSTADTFLEYIQRNLPESVGLKVTKAELLPLPNFLKKSM